MLCSIINLEKEHKKEVVHVYIARVSCGNNMIVSRKKNYLVTGVQTHL